LLGVGPLKRFSDYTEYEHGEHIGPTTLGLQMIAHTNLHHRYQGQDYTSRVERHLSPAEVAVEEESFLERRHRRVRRP
jgi:hypothetical protein